MSLEARTVLPVIAAVDAAPVLLFVVGILGWKPPEIPFLETLFTIVFLVGFFGTVIYGLGVNYARHELSLPFWANLLISPFWYGVWAMVRFRLGRLDCRQR